MQKSRGFSLLEMMIASSISALLFLGFFVGASQFQTWSSNLSLMMERDANVWLAPLLLSRWITAAGNNRWAQTWSGVTIQPGELEINSDIDGTDGFPDSRLASSFEALVIRCSRSNLQVKSGRSSFQPLIKNVTGLEIGTEDGPAISLRLTSVTDRPLSLLQTNLSEPTDLLFFPRNYRDNLFAEHLR